MKSIGVSLISLSLVLFFTALLSSCNDNNSPSPALGSISPATDGVGTEVQIKGKHFGTTISQVSVKFNGTSAEIQSVVDTLIVTHVPSGATTGKIELTIEGKTTFSQNDFVVLSGSWQRKKDMPGLGRAYNVGFSIAGKGYICGGHGPTGLLADVYEYDPDLDQWTQKGNMPGVRDRHTAFVIDGKAYVGLGRNTSDNDISTFYVYDPSSDEWTPIADFPGGARELAMSFSIGTKGYVGLGYNYDYGNFVTTTYKDLWQYDPSTDEWTQLADFPGTTEAGTLIGNYVSLAVDQKGYVGLGSPDNDWWSYDPVLDTWASRTPFDNGLSAIYSPVNFTMGGKIYVVGELRRCWEYDPATDHWQQKTSAPTSDQVMLSGGFSIGDAGYITSGVNNEHNTLWKFSAE